MQFNFDLGTPFKPFEQLMGVLPAASSEHIPLAYRVRLRWFPVRILVLISAFHQGFDVRRELADIGLLSRRLHIRPKWEEAGMGSCRQNSFYSTRQVIEGNEMYVSLLHGIDLLE